ncbi:hypothetical protein A0H81_06805 [Grifola frondosa]|uniref:Uncharacterized protein n=1 Tax=Grifola frondosa TaxID=5627 RepID=A0A1C7M7Q7_GRIFR|nr:hypothetical protein A0H81_06805 [Grifola frondosa]
MRGAGPRLANRQRDGAFIRGRASGGRLPISALNLRVGADANTAELWAVSGTYRYSGASSYHFGEGVCLSRLHDDHAPRATPTRSDTSGVCGWTPRLRSPLFGCSPTIADASPFSRCSSWPVLRAVPWRLWHVGTVTAAEPASSFSPHSLKQLEPDAHHHTFGWRHRRSRQGRGRWASPSPEESVIATVPLTDLLLVL